MLSSDKEKVGRNAKRYFDSKLAAQLYSSGRPHMHSKSIQLIKEFLSLNKPEVRALDVGCGTGLSTIALEPIAREIVGVDISPQMIKLAPTSERIRYVATSADALPFREDYFDILTLSDVFHWLDRNRFLPEAHRILRPEGWLISYGNGGSALAANMDGKPEFQRWIREDYLTKYPFPPRNNVQLDPSEARKEGFESVKQVQYDNNILLSIESIVDFLLTQSNVFRHTKTRKESEQLKTWLSEKVKVFFDDKPTAPFTFPGRIWYMKKVPYEN